MINAHQTKEEDVGSLLEKECRIMIVKMIQNLENKMELQINSLEKAMAPHSSTLAWKIPWMKEPGGLQSMGSLRVGHN